MQLSTGYSINSHEVSGIGGHVESINTTVGLAGRV
jgi:hypothetical protein